MSKLCLGNSSNLAMVVELELTPDNQYQNSVDFKVLEAETYEMNGDVSTWKTIASGHFGYDGCMHFRLPYEHFCKAEQLTKIGKLMEQAQEAILTGKVKGYEAVR